MAAHLLDRRRKSQQKTEKKMEESESTEKGREGARRKETPMEKMNPPGGIAPGGQGEDSEWTQVEHPKYKRMFYYNRRTKKSTWEKPKESEIDATAAASQNDESSGANLVWEKHVHKEFGVPYYWNNRERRSTWTPPDHQKSDLDELRKLCELETDVVEESEVGSVSALESNDGELQSAFPTGAIVKISDSKHAAILNGMTGVAKKSQNGRVIVEIGGKNLAFLPGVIELVAYNPFSSPSRTLSHAKASLKKQAEITVEEPKNLRRAASTPLNSMPGISAVLLQSVKLRSKEQQAPLSPVSTIRSPSPTLLEALRNNVMFKTSQQKLCHELDDSDDGEFD